jgi:YidC/Oxa1 family membrane protein insertase
VPRDARQTSTPMPNIRPLLLIALAFVGYLLWQAWEQDYHAPAPPPGTEVPPQPAAAADTPATPVADVPGAPADATPAPSADASATAEPVIVETDVLRVAIDPVGGTVRHVELLRYPIDPKRKDAPVRLLGDDAQRFFVAQSGLVATGPAPDHRARYAVEQRRYRLSGDTLEVPLTWNGDGVSVRKLFRFTRGSYVVDVEHIVDNAGAQPWIGSVYRQLQRTVPAVDQKFSFTNPEQYSFVGAAWYSPDEKFEKLAFDEFAEEPLKREFAGGWAAMLQHYFFAAWIPPATEQTTYQTDVVAGAVAPRYLIRAVGRATTVAPGAQATFGGRLYVGPKLQNELPDIAPGLEFTIDYGLVTVLAEPLFWLLDAIHKLVGNWGVAIILLTFLIKLAFYKLSEAQYRSMAKMRKLQPRLAALKERYGDDREKLNQAMMEFYQKEKINPMGGCLPILVQIPVFIALYWVLLESVELRQAPFLGWIDNLSDRDPYFVLPVLNGLAMYAAQKLTPTPGMDPMQQRVMQMMPIMFAVMFAFFPAGLVLYWTVNGVLGLVQQWVITNRVEGGKTKAA